MQLNLNRSSAAHDLVMESEPKADVLIASEPNKKRMDSRRWRTLEEERGTSGSKSMV
jgi:hypothetical protein